MKRKMQKGRQNRNYLQFKDKLSTEEKTCND